MLYNKTVSKTKEDLRQRVFQDITKHLGEELITARWWSLWKALEVRTHELVRGLKEDGQSKSTQTVQ